MTWHSFPHIPEEGAHIICKYKGCPTGNLFDKVMVEGMDLKLVEKWCYYDDYQNAMQHQLKNFI